MNRVVDLWVFHINLNTNFMKRVDESYKFVSNKAVCVQPFASTDAPYTGDYGVSFYIRDLLSYLIAPLFQ